MRRRSNLTLNSSSRVFVAMVCGFSLSQPDSSLLLGQSDVSRSNPPSLESYQPSDFGAGRYASDLESLRREAIYWSKSEFTIPFHVDASGKQPAEVQLEISIDNGENWSLYSRDSLQSRQFRFTSTQDGLYLFRIKTIDESGRSHDPGGQLLKVFVDTKSPELTLAIDTDSQGRMVADFAIIDSNPQADSLRLEYQTEQSTRWTSIAFESKRSGNEEISGRGVWDVPVTARQLVVRLIARDAAGNESEVTRLPVIPKTAMGNGGMQFASGAPSPRFGQNHSVLQNAPINNAPGMQAAKKDSKLVSTTPAPAVASFGSPFSSPTQSAKGNAKPPFPTKSFPEPTGSVVSSVGPYTLQQMSNEPTVKVPEPDAGGALYLNESTKASMTSNAPVFGESTLRDPDRVEAPLGTTQSLTDKPYYSNSRAFSLDYEVDTQAASPVASVELWGTADGGRVWERWGTDPDGVSPFDIKVETEGLFGFRMVIVGANGLAGNRPSNGDNADAWIHVDTEKPTARISSALYGKGTESSSLVVEYLAKDAYFGERPITLSYSELPTGPWTTIANGMRNTGRFVWPADPTLPRRVYLKLEAHDEAGNIGEHRLDIPVDIEGLAPRGRIQGFRPITSQ